MGLARSCVAALVLCVTLATPAPAEAAHGWHAAFLSQDPWPTVVPQREILYDGVYGRLRTVRQGPDGSLYLTTSNGTGDRIVRITPG